MENLSSVVTSLVRATEELNNRCCALESAVPQLSKKLELSHNSLDQLSKTNLDLVQKDLDKRADDLSAKIHTETLGRDKALNSFAKEVDLKLGKLMEEAKTAESRVKEGEGASCIFSEMWNGF